MTKGKLFQIPYQIYTKYLDWQAWKSSVHVDPGQARTWSLIWVYTLQLSSSKFWDKYGTRDWKTKLWSPTTLGKYGMIFHPFDPKDETNRVDADKTAS